MKQGLKLLSVLLLTLLLAASATAQINWMKQDGSTKYLAWDDGTKSKTMFNGGSAIFATGYFGSTISQTVHLTVTINSKADGKIVSTIVSKDVNVNPLGYEVITVLPTHYKDKAGEYIIVIKLKDANTELVDTSLYLKVKPKTFIEIPFPFNPNDAPEMDDLDDKQVTENSNLQFTVSGTDADNDDLEFEGEVCPSTLGSLCFSGWDPLDSDFDSNPASLNEDTGVFKWKPSYDFVPHYTVLPTLLTKKIDFRFRAVDEHNKKSDWEKVTVTVKDKNRNPKFDNIPNKVVAEEQLLQFTISATDADDDKLEYSILTSSPPLIGAYLDQDSGVFKWVPNDMQAGIYFVTFKVVDKFGGKDLENIVIQVTDLPVDEPQCDDGLDNDGDVVVDENDPGCHTDGDPDNNGTYDPTDNDETDEAIDEPECNDGVDNDTDGETDFPDDPGCTDEDDNNETDDPVDEPQCNDDLDNDGDGKKDYPNDPGCDNQDDDNEGDEPQCKDGQDNDDDGFVDLHDPDCENEDDDSEDDTPEDKPQCDDGIDNDGDELTDYPADPGCKSETDDLEKDSQCIDGIDNDGDGLIDFPQDPGCSTPDDNSETNKPQCDDGLDNDGDHIVDLDDPGCSSKDDNNESDEPQCKDGKDNDLDGKIDYPQDTGCLTPDDNNENNNIPPEEDSSPNIDLQLQSVHLEHEVLEAGNTLFINVRVFNDGDEDFEELKVQAKIFDLGVWGSTGKFTLDSGKGKNSNVYVDIPLDAEPGWHLVKVTVKNSHYHTSTYRLVYIESNTFQQWSSVPTQ